MAEVRALVDHQAFDLVEHRRVGLVGIDCGRCGPGMMMRIGGFCFSMVRICTGEVCVRSSSREPSGLRIEEERVVHLARRMAFGEVQRVKL